MARAIELARRGLYTTHPNPRVGCVIVRDGVVVGEGWHERAGEGHAEVRALAVAGDKARGAAVYVTLEPCCHHGRTPPCTDALVAAGVTRVVSAMSDPNPQVSGGGTKALREAGIDTVTGVMADEAAALNRGFISRMQRGRPFVRAKLGMSLDGRTAAADGKSQWITSEASREDVHRLRAECGAVLTGIGTVLADDPSLNVRLPGEWMPPMRIVLDSKLRMPPRAKMLTIPGPVIVFTAAKLGTAGLQRAGAHVAEAPTNRGRLDLEFVLRELGKQMVNEVLVEAGPTLTGSLLAAGLVDELILYVAPTLLGDEGRGLVRLPGVRSLDQKLSLAITDVRPIGPDWRIMAAPRGTPPRG
jgi:diaminohydroxyphosphoribosylaminopyrimidine deaminase/5-amino-6-(5-phosphoribosylamino)uracil reductase